MLRKILLNMLIIWAVSINAQNYLGDNHQFLPIDKQLNLNATGAGSAHVYQVVNNFTNAQFKYSVEYLFNPSASNYFQFYFAPTQNPEYNIPNNALLFNVGENGNNDALTVMEWEGTKWVQKQRIGNTILARATKIDLELNWVSDSVYIHLITPNNSTKVSCYYPKNTANSQIQVGFFTKFSATNSKKIKNLNFTAKEWVLDERKVEIVSDILVNPKEISFFTNKNIQKVEIINTNIPIKNSSIIGNQIVFNPDSISQTTPIYISLLVTDNFDLVHTLEIRSEMYYPKNKDLIVTEILLKPNTNIHPLLPTPFIEIYNNSNHILNLSEFKLIVRESEVILPKQNLSPNSFITLSDFAYTNSNHFVTSLPSLVQSGCEIEIWYNNNLMDYWNVEVPNNDLLKNLGGFSLNRIGNGYCFNNQSVFSNDKSGATLGKSDWNTINDIKPYSIHKILHLQDTLFEIQLQNYLSNLNDINIEILNKENRCRIQQYKGKSILFYYSDSLSINELTLKINANNCGEQIHLQEKFKIGKPKNYAPQNLKINEIMYDAVKENNNYIEFYVSDKACWNINDLRMGTWEDNTIKSISLIGNPKELICGGEYFIACATNQEIQSDFPNVNSKYIAQSTSFISLRNTGNTIGLWFKEGTLLDSVLYHPNLHHPNIQNSKGIALEKKLDGSWSSASWALKGTPTQENSSLDNSFKNINQIFTISKLIVAHLPEYEKLHIEINELDTDYLLTLNLWDASGQFLQNLYNQYPIQSFNKLSISSLNYPPGIYILNIEFINPETAQKHQYKQSITFN